MWFQGFNYSYNCQTSHYLGRNWLQKPFLILPSLIHVIRFEIWDLRSKDLKIFLGHDINYLSIWPFMRHPWFPTRKASKLIFVCFQLAGEWHNPASWKQSHGHHPASWKQVNVSFEAFLVGNQGWRIKGQMLR